jgi:hypothetical protein
MGKLAAPWRGAQCSTGSADFGELQLRLYVMTVLARLPLAVVFALSFSASAWAYDLPGLWTLKVENRSHHVVATLTVKFTDRKAQSCMSGDWLQVAVVSAATKDPHFYSISSPLAFNIEKNKLTIGSVEICDAYVMLTGALNDRAIRGEYYGLGLGGTEPLGFFILSRGK